MAVCQVPFCAKKSIVGSWLKIQGYLKEGMHYGLGIENLLVKPSGTRKKNRDGITAN